MWGEKPIDVDVPLTSRTMTELFGRFAAVNARSTAALLAAEQDAGGEERWSRIADAILDPPTT